MITTRLRSGELLRLRRGVYLAASAWPDDPAAQHVVLARAEVAANPAATISRQSAAVIWQLPTPGFEPWYDAPVSVTLPAGTGLRSWTNGAVHHVERLPPEDVVRDAAGYPVTSIARTAVDLAVGQQLPEALVIVDAAARALCAAFVAQPRRSDYANARLVEAARGQLSGVAGALQRGCLSTVIELADPARESPAESLTAGHFHLGGVPKPLFNPPIRTPVGVLFPDCLWPEQRLIGECDGAVKYANSGVMLREKDREQVLRDLDYGIVRWQPKELRFDPNVVVRRVLRELDARRPTFRGI
jgi:hypothetical protein